MIVVNPNTRQFSIPGADLVFGVEADSGSEVKHFQCPSFVGNNLEVANTFIRINYRNANGETDSYLVDDVTVDGDNVHFSWLLAPKVTAYKGQVKFVMCLVGPDLKVKWHTAMGTGQVHEGLEPDQSHIEDETDDVVAALITMVEQQTAAVESEGSKQIRAVQDAALAAQTASVAEIEAKGVNTRNSIPADYTALSKAVDSLTRDRAGAIVCEAEGAAVTLRDASNLPIQGLRVFGRSTQDGVPTPEAPVEIKSVESPILVAGGKNFFDVSAEVVLYSLPVQTTKDGLITLDRTAGDIWGDWMPLVLKKSVPYTISVEFVEKETPSEGVTFRTSDIANKNGVDVTAIRLMYSIDGRVSYTFTPSKDTNYIQFYLQSSWSLDSKISFKNVQVEAGSVATDYEPYKPVQGLEITRPLRGVPVTSGGNYTDENGQQWICDEVDLERGVYVQRIGHRAFDGTETAWRRGTMPTGEPMNYVYFSDYAVENLNLSLCSHSVFAAGGGYWNNGGYMRSGTGYWQTLTDMALDEWKAYLSEQNANGTPLVVCYVLSKPIETPLSETEIAAYRALHTNKPNTTVLNDSGAHMKVEYAADTKLYIDQRIKGALL